jgi:phosphoglycolate phosphatase
MNDLKLVVFDCDGTLVDSLQMIQETMFAAYQHQGCILPADTDVGRVIGLSLEVAIANLSPEFDEQKCHDLAVAYREHFHALRQEGKMVEPLYPHVRETIIRLDKAGYVMGIATGKGIRGLNHVLDLHDMAHFFTTLQTPDNAPGKPHPGMLENAMATTGVQPENTFMVGDTSYDMEMAVHAGVHGIGVDWGYHEVAELQAAGARSIISQMTALDRLLEDA